MVRRHSVAQPLAFRLIEEFFISDDDEFEESKPISNKEFYSILAMLIVGVVVLAVTIGPFALV